MIILTISETFSAAHSLPDYEGKCKNLHGHTWKLEVSFSFQEKDIQTSGSESGMAVDFSKLKGIIRDAVPDHQFINSLVGTPTAENIAMWLYREIEKRNPEHFQITMVRLWESDSASVIYIPDLTDLKWKTEFKTELMEDGNLKVTNRLNVNDLWEHPELFHKIMGEANED